MNLLWAILASIALSRSTTLGTSLPAKRYYDSHNYYALEHKPDPHATTSLEDVARSLGVEVVERAGELDDTWLVRAPKPDFLVREEDRGVLDPVISTFENLRLKASSPLAARSEEGLYAREVVSSVTFLERQTPAELVKRAPPSIRPPTKTSAQGVANRLGLKDPLFTEQWHIVNDEHPEHMMNNTPVWDMGFTGKGVITSFLDDGLDFDTEDLKDAFMPEFSYDFNAHVPLPRPTGVRDHHGTRCAGQVVARRNEQCGVGIAYDAMAAGVRILGGPISTVDEAAALNYGFKNVSIYSCSWGPRDDGATMEGPNYLIRKAVTNGINKGRDGKGSIFVFASGNGGRFDDQCNFDGYTNSIYSVTVSSIDHAGMHPSYSEACAANMIVAYSSGDRHHIVTTDRGDECSRTHGGTSAAAPNAVGIFALALQARPDLTWRDIQHLCVNTARFINPNDPDWEKTAAGRMFSYKYGYGAIDGYAFVKAAQDWKLVKPQAWLHTKTIQLNDGKMDILGKKKFKYHGGIKIGRGVESKMTITKEMMTEHNLETIEHIDIRVWIDHTRRGDIEVELISPNGIKSKLAGVREFDDATTGYPGWRFMTLKHWGENPLGDWKIKVNDQNDDDHNGSFLGWNLAFWGSAIDPAKAKKFVEPVVDNALPPNTDPDRPIIGNPDFTATTQHAKPTDLLPTDHGHASGENSKLTFPTQTPKPKPKPEQDDEDASSAWYSHMSSLVASQKWFFAALGAVTVFGIGALIYFWKRRVARQKLAAYTSLAADDIHMGTIGEDRSIPGGGGPRTTRALYDAFGEPTSADELPPREQNVNPPTARGLGFHSGFLDDDEPSAGLTPKYRDEPDTESHSDDAVMVRRSGEDSTPRSSRAGSQEHLT